MSNISVLSAQNISLLVLDNIPADIGFISLVFDRLSDEKVNIDMISQTPPRGKCTSLSFTFGDGDLAAVLACIKKIKADSPSLLTSVSSANSKITVISEDMKNGHGFASRVFAAVSRASGDVRLITTSETEISLLVPELDEKQCISAIEACFK